MCRFQSHTLANNEVQIGSISSIPAALMRVCNLSAYHYGVSQLSTQSSNIESQSRQGGNSYSDIKTVVGEDQRGVGGGEFGVRHFEYLERN